MSNTILGWLIMAVDLDAPEGENTKYYGIDWNSGGYPWWSPWFASAKVFKTAEAAEKVLREDSDFHRPSRVASGEVYPPVLLHDAAGLCNTKTRGRIQLRVVPLEVGVHTYQEAFAVSMDWKGREPL